MESKEENRGKDQNHRLIWKLLNKIINVCYMFVEGEKMENKEEKRRNGGGGAQLGCKEKGGWSDLCYLLGFKGHKWDFCFFP